MYQRSTPNIFPLPVRGWIGADEAIDLDRPRSAVWRGRWVSDVGTQVHSQTKY